MLFHTVGFLFLFLPLFLVALRLAPNGLPKALVVLSFSYLFYSGADPRFVLVLLFSSTLDYVAALQIHRTERPALRRAYLMLSVTANLGLLAYFKYGPMLFPPLAPLGRELGLPMPDEDFYRLFVLPAGISFYTFQSMSYTIDVYRKRIVPERSFVAILGYVSFMPQLIAGPIERFGTLGPQLADLVRGSTHWRFWAGLDRLCLGIIQKLLIADSCGFIVDRLAGAADTPTLFSSWALAVGFGMQIYYDFAGYTHMAIGIALMVGVRLSENFLSPYKAGNIRDFWRRWHVTLSNWFRDYLYIPLGGSARGPARTALNVAVTFGLCGLWHGAGWNFAAWGLLHGAMVGGYHVLSGRADLSRIPPAAGVALTFAAVHFAWVPFRIDDPDAILRVWQGMIGLNGFGLGAVSVADLLFVAVVTAFTLTLPNASERWPGRSGWIESAALMALALAAIVSSPEIVKFIYFQF